MKKKFYAIRVGRKNNVVVGSWPSCQRLVDGYPGAIFKGFANHQKTEAEAFAQRGQYRSHTKVVKPKAKKSFWDNDKYPCIARGDYWKNGKLLINRCVVRRGPTKTGEDYIPSNDRSVPWD